MLTLICYCAVRINKEFCLIKKSINKFYEDLKKQKFYRNFGKKTIN